MQSECAMTNRKHSKRLQTSSTLKFDVTTSNVKYKVEQFCPVVNFALDFVELMFGVNIWQLPNMETIGTYLSYYI